VLWVLGRYEEVRRASELARPSTPTTRIGAFFDPLREVRATPALWGAFGSVAAFGVSATIIMAILPAFAKHALGASASGYGALLSALGCGAITSGLFLARLRTRFGKRVTVSTGIAAYGIATFLASRAEHVASALPCFFLAGLGWIACLTTLSASVQLTARTETKSRVTALYQLNFYVWLTVGAWAGGALAERWNERVAVAVGGLGCVVAAAITSRLLEARPRPAILTASG
jgi:predicted MFS family arabinose efflux permease